jgi:iron(III) transport system ATP-binding protein
MTADANSTPEPYLRIVDLTKAFGEFTALQDISLQIQEGEFVCFLGPSGCGKTTLLRAIAGLDIQTSGTVEQNGQDISALPPYERDFGIVFQSYALFPNLTVAKNVAYGLENRKISKRDVLARVAELLQLVGLPDQGDKYPRQLSGGQQQRIALARAIATSPGLLLLDEPLSALDAKVRVHLRHGHNHGDGDARPGRGLNHGRPHRGDEPGSHRADRYAGGYLPPPQHFICRRFHRHDEFRTRHGRGAERSAVRREPADL